MTTVFSQQKGESSVVEVKGGAQITDYEITVDDYEANRHFFLSQHFKDNFDVRTGEPSDCKHRAEHREDRGLDHQCRPAALRM
ncbi:MAG: hypothetical protein MZV63_42700 [Marinilabiliales bacterium]|nr:hypothetical protein [Marinilabiliales bacterium]